ncbi:MAG: Phosphonates import ATP-binding protein PhnC [Pseudomonadota bacterium]|jgi:phosphonate transport system ATP-binding protein
MGFRLAGIGLIHGNGHPALSDLSLSVAPGEAVALIGPSGAGKTSLLSLLGGALAPSSGSGAVLGHDLAQAAAPAWRARIGLIHQAAPIPPRQRVVTAVLAGRLGRWPWWKGLISLLHPVDIPGARAALARLDIADKLFVRADQLSGGQLQRVGIARVLYQQPELILADEPVAALDPTLARATIRLLCADAAERGATLVTSLHAVELALAHFPRIIGLREGRVQFDLPAAGVTPALLQALYAGEAESSPLAAGQAQQLAPGSAANDAATRAACC